jgi:hypothetical protein
MNRMFATLALAALAAAPVAVSSQTTAASAQTTDVLAPVHQFVDGFNKGDTKSALAACGDQTSIIDEFPPHEWHGAGACAKWMNDYDANAKKNAITDGVVTLSAPLHVDVAGDHAYVVIPSNYAYKSKGRTIKETGSLFTFALQKGPAGWRIIGWSWAKR